MLLRGIILGVLALGGAAFAWQDAAVAYWLKADAASAPSAIGGNPRIVSASHDKLLLGSDPISPEDLRLVDVTAKRVLAETPLDASAMRQVALASRLIGRDGFREELLLAERISRRDLATQTALLGLASIAGDYEGFFLHLDRAFTVRPSAVGTLNASFAQSLGDPKLRAGLIRHAQRPWFPWIVKFATEMGSDPANVATLLIEGRIRLPDYHAGLIPRLLDKLMESDRYDVARQLVSTAGAMPPAALDDFGFNAATVHPETAPVGWRLITNERVETRLGTDAALEIDVQPEKMAAVAERVTGFPPGSYSLEQRAGVSGDIQDTYLQWELVCGSRGQVAPIWNEAKAIRAGQASYAYPVSIPENCTPQRWRLRVLPGEGQSAATVRIDTIALRKSGGEIAR
jgi:hypothetical protein